MERKKKSRQSSVSSIVQPYNLQTGCNKLPLVLNEFTTDNILSSFSTALSISRQLPDQLTCKFCSTLRQFCSLRFHYISPSSYFVFVLLLLSVLLTPVLTLSVSDLPPDILQTMSDPRPFHTGKDHYTQFWAVEINGTVEDAKKIASRNGYIYISQIMPGIFNFRHPRIAKRSAQHSFYAHQGLNYEPKVKWLQQQIARVRVKRDLTVYDPKWPDMWYLNRNDRYGSMDMNVRSVWERGYTGQGVVITILDDGLEINHPDLKLNYDKIASCDVNGNDQDPTPRYDVKEGNNSNRHGTRCAGEVAAVANNSFCGLGIAYRASIGGIRMLDGDVTDSIESQSLSHAFNHVDIYSASWGPEDDGSTVDGPGLLAQRAFHNGIHMGRGGLGSIFVWASGNGGKNKDNCNCDGYTNSIYTLGVSSVSESGTIPWYAEMCSSTLAVTYSSGSSNERSVVTTDLNGTCTENHSGTSASAPLAAGICALVLSANRKLSWRDMQHLVVRTARPDGLFSNEWRVNGVGRRVSHAFGYGLMDAEAMVNLAVNWTSVAPQHVCEARARIEGHMILRQHTSEILNLDTSACHGRQDQEVRYLEHVQAKVTLSSSNRGEVELWLISPNATVSKLLSKRPRDLAAAGFQGWPFMSVHYWGENPVGTWKLTVWSGGAKVSIQSWSLVFYGTDVNPVPYKEAKKKAKKRRKNVDKSDPRESHLPIRSVRRDQGSSGNGAAPSSRLCAAGHGVWWRALVLLLASSIMLFSS